MCLEGSWYVEYSGLETDTGACNYLALSQPLEIDLDAGEPLTLLLWHQVLVSDDPSAEAHVALLFEDQIGWEITVSIPADPTVYEVEFAAPSDLAAGSAVHFHLHNHGANTYQLNELTALR